MTGKGGVQGYCPHSKPRFCKLQIWELGGPGPPPPVHIHLFLAGSLVSSSKQVTITSKHAYCEPGAVLRAFNVSSWQLSKEWTVLE